MLEKVGTFVLSDSSLDRHSERVIVEGIDLENFKNNPVMYYNHHRSAGAYWGDADSTKLLPIGVWQNIRKSSGQLVADAYIDYNDEFAAKVGDKVKAGVLRSTSIGFRALAYSDADEDKVTGQRGLTITKSELHEASIVDIPANPNALLLTNSIKSKSEENALDLKSEPLYFFKNYTSKSLTMTVLEQIANKTKAFLGLGAEASNEDVLELLEGKSLEEMIDEKIKGIDEPESIKTLVTDLKSLTEKVDKLPTMDAVTAAIEKSQEDQDIDSIKSDLEEKITDIANSVNEIKGKPPVKGTQAPTPDYSKSEKAFVTRQEKISLKDD